MTKHNTKEAQIEKICRIMYKQLRRSGHSRQDALEIMRTKAHAIASFLPYRKLVFDWINENDKETFRPRQAHQLTGLAGKN